MGQSTLSLLAKDLMFVLPAYFSFFFLERYPIQRTRLPGIFVAGMAMLTIIVLLQAANPNLPNLLVPLIGIKVWLLYLPLAFLSAAIINDVEDLNKLLRMLVLISVIPLAVGFLQRVGVEILGRETVVQALYGSSFDNERYTLFTGFEDYGGDLGGTLYRINATFSAGGQYVLYLLTMVPVCLTLSMIERNKRWRLFAQVMTVAAIVAAVLSGSRGAAVFLPAVIVPALILQRKISALLLWSLIGCVAYVVSLTYSGIDVGVMLDFVWDYTFYNVQGFGAGQLFNTFMDHPLGMGTGMNTGSARYAFLNEDVAAGVLSGLEVYYAKTIAELSLIGLIPVAIILGAPLIFSIKTALSGGSANARLLAAGLSGFFLMVIIVSYKAWPLDADPINVMFWVLAGALYKAGFIGGSAIARSHPVAGRLGKELSPAQ